MIPCYEQECEPAVGRLLVFSVEGQGAERKVNLVAEVETRGAVYVLNGFNGKLLAGINSKVGAVLLRLFWMVHTRSCWPSVSTSILIS